MPVAQNTPGFTSFADYLNANQGSLEQERGQVLGAAQSQVDQVGADAAGLGTAAYGQGKAAGVAAGPQTYDSTQADWTSYSPDTGTVTHAAGHNAPNVVQPPPYDASSTPQYAQLNTDLAKANDTVAGLGSGIAAGKTEWESGLLGADPGYRDSAKKMQGSLGTLDSYLSGVGDQYKSGFGAGRKQATTDATTAAPGEAGNEDGDFGAPGAPLKPTYNRNRRTEQP